MNVVDEFYPEEVLRLYFRDRLDNTIEKYRYKFEGHYQDVHYNTMRAIDYDSVYVQQNSNYDAVGDRAVAIADLRLHAERRYLYLKKAKKAVNRLLDSLNEKEKNTLDFYFSYENELEEACINLNQSFKEGREEYKETKKLVRYCCNELDKMLL